MTDESFLFIENEKTLAVYQNFLKIRKDTFHYILNKLVKNKHFIDKKEAGKNLKDNFSKFYGKNKELFIYKDDTWKIKVFKNNHLKPEEKEIVKKNYVSNFTKINPKKGSKNYKVLNTPLSYVNLDSMYGK